MTEKRFELAYETNRQNVIWWAVRDGDITLYKEETVATLNELYEENEQLKQRNDLLRDFRGFITKKQIESEPLRIMIDELKDHHFTQMGGFTKEHDGRGRQYILSKNVIPMNSPVVNVKSPNCIWNEIVTDIIWNIISEGDRE